MRYAPTEYAFPEAPPEELLAELDAAARALDELCLRSIELTLDMDARAGHLRIERSDEDGTHALTPTELFQLLGGPASEARL